MTLPTPSPDVVFQKLEDGAVLFAPGTETYFGLNEVGALVWQLLPPVSGSLDELTTELAARFAEVPAATIRTDVLELLDDLVREGLARDGAAGAPDAASPA